MSKPFETADGNPAQSALAEIISAISSLHMGPEPIPKEHPDDNDFLAYTDANVKHALLHLHQAAMFCDLEFRISHRVREKIRLLACDGKITLTEMDKILNLWKEELPKEPKKKRR